MRLPSSSTRVRSGPRLRRSTYWPPTSSPEDSASARLIAGEPVADRFCTMSATLVKPCFSMSARCSAITGCAVSVLA